MESTNWNGSSDAYAKPRDWNRWIVTRLRDVAGLLEQQGAKLFRINAYYCAAETLEELDSDIRQIYESDGVAGFIALPNIGRTRDCVVIYYHADDEPKGQCTVVTEHLVPLRGLRRVRGREKESGRVHACPEPWTCSHAEGVGIRHTFDLT